MFMHLTRELARADRLKSEVSLLVMDLDNFKDINDTYGHHVGDRALREVAGVLRAAIRPYDICVRYAGDEFIVVLSGCGGEEAERKRLELQRAVDSLQFEARPGKMLPLAISVGAAVFPHDGDSYETLLATADSRMYRDKTRRKRELGRRRRRRTPTSVAEQRRHRWRASEVRGRDSARARQRLTVPSLSPDSVSDSQPLFDPVRAHPVSPVQRIASPGCANDQRETFIHHASKRPLNSTQAAGAASASTERHRGGPPPNEPQDRAARAVAEPSR